MARRVLPGVGILAIATLLFVAYSYLPLSAPPRDTSPDENSNRYFSNLYAETGKLWLFEPIDQIYPGVVHPRSVVLVDNLLVPGGFLGLPIVYGGIGRVIGSWSLPLLTAFFAILGLIGFWLTLKGSFGGRLALWATLLLAVQPVWLYQASRPFMPNVLFLSLLLLSTGFFFGRPLGSLARRRSESVLSGFIDAAVAGVFLTMTLMVRPTEAYWLAVIAVILFLVFGMLRYWKSLLSLFITAVMTAVPFLLINRTVYGGFLASGYGLSPTDVSVGSLPGGLGAKLIGPLQPYLFPLGFAPRTALENFWSFGVGLFSWWWVLVALAALIALTKAWLTRKRIQEPRQTFGLTWIAVGLSVSVWLILFYGSWVIKDNPDLSAVTIGSSYLRYWLPIFALSVIPVAWVMEFVWSKVRFGRVLAVMALVGVAIASVLTVYLAPQEGILAMRENLRRFDYQAERILSIVEPKKIVVVDRADKFVWPDRPVIQPLRTESTWKALAFLGPRMRSIYYYGITLPEKDIAWLNETKLPPMGLKIRLVEGMGEESLYVFEYQGEAAKK